MVSSFSPPHPLIIEPLIRNALREDMGRAGDITSEAIAPPGLTARAALTFRQGGQVCGLPMAEMVFRLVDDTLRFTTLHADGSTVNGGTTVARIAGSARGILSGERVALNLVARLSAIATITRSCVAVAKPHGCTIACTRKTTPGLRLLEKYAVRTGGGANHRFGLDDAVLIKDNHIAVAGGVGEAVRRAKAHVGHMVKIEVEVDTLDQLREGLACAVDAVLLDNMEPHLLRQAVALVDGRVTTEASGGITPENLATIAATGVDVVSLGFLTHGAQSLDVGLDFED